VSGLERPLHAFRPVVPGERFALDHAETADRQRRARSFDNPERHRRLPHSPEAENATRASIAAIAAGVQDEGGRTSSRRKSTYRPPGVNFPAPEESLPRTAARRRSLLLPPGFGVASIYMLRLRRAAKPEDDREHDQYRRGKKLELPVLEGLEPESHVTEVSDERMLGISMQSVT